MAFWNKLFEKTKEGSIQTKTISQPDNTTRAQSTVQSANVSKPQTSAELKEFEINSEEDAKRLFTLCQPYQKMRKEYSEETIKAFEQYATSEKKKEWVIEECRQVLQGIVNGEHENAYDKLSKINGRCAYFLGSASAVLIEDYTKACKELFECGEERFVVHIKDYLSYVKRK